MNPFQRKPKKCPGCGCTDTLCAVYPSVPCEPTSGARYTECTGFVGVHLALNNIDAQNVGPRTDFTSWTAADGNPYSPLSGAGGFPIIFNTTLQGGITGMFSPLVNANTETNQGNIASNYTDSYSGFRLTQIVNGETNTFDVRPTGFTVTATHSDFNSPKPDPGYSTWSVSRLTSWHETIREECYTDALATRETWGAHPSNLTTNYQWSINYWRSTVTFEKLISKFGAGGGDPTTDYYENRQTTYAQMLGGRYYGESISLDSLGPCAREAFIVPSASKSIIIGRSGLIGYPGSSTSITPVFDITADTSKTATLQFVLPDLMKVGCRDCPRKLLITGTFQTICHPTEGTPFYDRNEEPWAHFDSDLGEWVPGPEGVYETVSFSQKMDQSHGGKCGTYGCYWYGGTTVITTSGGDFEFDGIGTTLGYYLYRVSPVWWIIRTAAGEWDLKFTGGDCPDSGTWEVRQDVNPHVVNHHDLPYPWAPALNASSTYELQEPYAATFTNRTLNVTAIPCDEDSPPYFCDGTCSGPSTVPLNVRCETGTAPPGWAGSLLMSATIACGCKYTGNNGVYRATLTYQQSTGKWYAKVIRNADNVTMIDGYYTGPSTDPTGIYPFVGSQWDEVCGNLAILVNQ